MPMDIKKKIQLIKSLAEIVDELGWVIAIPPDEITPGLIIGEEDYVKAVSNSYYGEQFDIINPNESKEQEFSDIADVDPVIKETVH